ncbi:MAG: 50S ribosomal protein L4 [Candidatus Omnitrophota bacterium]|nr:MAG: 50S ribosomal protein L4 [Candidatus Omnitrophota bacterium]
MKSISVLDKKGKVAAKFSLDETYFDGKVNKPLLHQTVLMYLDRQRKRTASTKTRRDVRGGGRKPWRQKGTGRARVGTIRSPLWRGGGVVFGPHPTQSKAKLPKSIKSLALKMSLNGKVKDNELVVVDKIPEGESKTKAFALFLKALKAEDKPLVVLEKHNSDILRATRNIPGADFKTFNNISALDVLRHKKVIFSKQALENLIKSRKE